MPSLLLFCYGGNLLVALTLPFLVCCGWKVTFAAVAADALRFAVTDDV
jgi:hypothetical protein